MMQLVIYYYQMRIEERYLLTELTALLHTLLWLYSIFVQCYPDMQTQYAYY